MSFKIAELQNSARQRAIELAVKEFQTPESLNNIKELQHNVLKQNEVIGNKLRTVLNGQVEESEVAMNNIGNSYEIHQEIQNYFKLINTKGKQSQDLYDNYQNIRKCIITSRNVRKAMEGLDRILRLQSEIKNIEDLIEKDYTQIYEAYEKVIKLEEVRDAALLESIGEHSFFLEVFQDYFKNINQCSNRFTDLIFKQILEYDGITTVGQETPQVLVQIARVIEEEEKRDQIRKEDLEKKQNEKKDKKKDDDVETLKLKCYKNRLFEVIENDIKVKIQLKIKPKDTGKDKDKPHPPPPVSIVLSEFSKLIVQQLEYAQFDVEPCFPESYRIMEFFINTYNKYIEEYINDLMKIRDELDYADTLAMSYWMRIDYPITIEDFLIRNTNAIDFKERAQTLMDEFIVNKNKTMIEGCRIAVEQDFRDDTKPLPKPGTGYPYTPGCVELFTMLNTQLDQVKESKNTRPDFVVHMVKTNTIIIISYSQLMIENIKKSLKIIKPLMLFSYSNNVTLCRNLLDQYMKRLLEMLPAEHHEAISQALNPGHDSFTDLLNHCLEAIMDIIQTECEEFWNLMFEPIWETKNPNPLDNIIEMVDNFQRHNVMEKEYTLLLYERILNKFIQKYLDSLILLKKPIKDSYGEECQTFEEKVEEDMTDLEILFLQNLQRDTIQEMMFPITNLRSFIKDLTKVKDDVEKFTFALNELLREYPQSWDAAASIVTQCQFLSTDMKKKMKEVIDSSFNKEYNSGAEPTQKKHPFLKYTKEYSIRERKENEKKLKPITQQIIQGKVELKKVVQPQSTHNTPVTKQPPQKKKETNVEQQSLEDLIGGPIEF